MTSLRLSLTVLAVLTLLLSACGAVPQAATPGQLAVVATTNIVGDVVANVAGDHIQLTTLLAPGVDPHSYEPNAQAIAAMEDADIIFVNGLDLEEFFHTLTEGTALEDNIVSVSDGVATIEFEGEEHDHEGEDHEHEDEHADEHEGEDHEHEDEHADEHEGEDHEHKDEHADEDHDHEEEGHHHSGADPHVWLDPENVIVWTANIADALSAADPANAGSYLANAATYTEELHALDAELAELLATIPADHRELVTDHDAFGYFAAAYDFEIIGAVIPGYSTLSEASAAQVADLISAITRYDTPAIFVGSTVAPTLAEQVAADTGTQLVPLYTGSLSAPEGPASTYLEMMRYNGTAIAEALK